MIQAINYHLKSPNKDIRGFKEKNILKMEEVLLAFAKIMPPDEMLEALSEYALEYKNNKSAENGTRLKFALGIVGLQLIRAHSNLDETIKEFNQMRDLYKIFSQKN